ncbi:MAG: cyclic nucleotide-binding domain-containing protein [Bacteriovoracaceae bacterium]
MTISLNENFKSEIFEKGDVLFQEGDKTSAFFIVVKGKVICAKKSSDRFVVVYLAKDKELVGEDSVFRNLGKHDYGAIALEKSELVRVESSDVYASVGNQSDWVRNILENLSDKVRDTADLIVDHRIEDDRLTGEEALSEEVFALIKKSLG